jgi:hypothetical protein
MKFSKHGFNQENPAMSDQSLHDDISYMRQMAEQGRRGPILGGAFLTAAGVIYGLACVVQWAMQTGLLPPPTGTSVAELWGGASALFAVVWLILFQRLRSQAGPKPGASQAAFGVAWASCGLGIVVMLIAIAIVSNRTGNSELMNLNPLVAFAFYGAAWFVSGALARQSWMFVAGLAAFAMTLIMALMSGAGTLLAMGAGLFVTLVLPGLRLMLGASR